MSAALCTEVLGNSWCGIEPLRSTRADVLRILGKPTNSLRYSDYFKLREYLVAVAYQVNDCKEDCGFGWNVPSGTVQEIGLMPTQAISKESLLANDKFERRVEGSGFVYFTDDRSGFEIETYNDRVTLITEFDFGELTNTVGQREGTLA